MARANFARPHRAPWLSPDDFEALRITSWTSGVEVVSSSLQITRGIPADRLVRVLASGCFDEPRAVSGLPYPLPNVVAGIEVIRFDARDSALGWPYNVDCYFLTLVSGTSAARFWGPYALDGHWRSAL